MEITSAALVSLACLLSNGKTEPQATEDFAKNLTENQIVAIQQIIDSGACLPKKFENKVKPGVGGKSTDNHAPTTDI